jgi:pyrroline-5-carboxylate reductase
MHPRAPLAVVGGGRMGEAIVSGLLDSGAFDAADVTVADPSAERRAALSAMGVRCVADAAGALDGASTVLLAVKPQVIDEVVSVLSPSVPDGALVVSIAAGVTCARLESRLRVGTAVVRVMPNAPALVRAGMSVVSGGSLASVAQVDEVRAMFASLGDAVVLDECHQDAATAISGSGPAYAARFVGALVAAGKGNGLAPDVATRLALQTVVGTAVLMRETNRTPEEIIETVASPGGTTVAALEQLDEHGFDRSVSAAVDAAVRRAKELGE